MSTSGIRHRPSCFDVEFHFLNVELLKNNCIISPWSKDQVSESSTLKHMFSNMMSTSEYAGLNFELSCNEHLILAPRETDPIQSNWISFRAPEKPIQVSQIVSVFGPQRNRSNWLKLDRFSGHRETDQIHWNWIVCRPPEKDVEHLDLDFEHLISMSNSRV